TWSSAAALGGLSPPAVLAGAAITTAIVILCASGPTIQFGAFPRPSLVAATAIAALLIGSLASVSSEPFVLLVGKVAFSALAVALIAWQGDFLMLAERAD
ncbi:hypothetical protein HY68_37360, partial [Streptomyces sp. AcH 505]|uniref:hypothetical protein n=1 Tax=Streptomyces sp. AcH 505 TaxID=352211 RepID=UPI000592301C